MNTDILCTLLAERIDPTKFQVRGIDIEWLSVPTEDEISLAADVIANYDTLEAEYLTNQETLANRIASITMRQARLQMLAMGVLSQVEAAVEAAGDSAKISWEYATTVQRDDTIFKAVKTALGFTDEQEKTFFNEGSLL